MERIRLGIVGVGGIGSAHFNCVGSGKIAGMTLGAVCDIDPERLEYCKGVYPGVPRFSDCGEMFSSGLIDAALVSVPHPHHAEIAERAFVAGLHVLVEKPEDISVSAARRLNEAAKRSGKVFGIMFNQRTDPIFRRAREIVRSGGIGEIKRSVWIITNWYRTQHYYDSGDWRATWSGEGGGVLLNQAPHNLDIWQWICGMPKRVTAFCGVGKWHDIEVEDDATIFAEYENGATGVFVTSTGDLPGTNRLEITGSLGSVTVEQGRLIYKKLLTDERVIRTTETRPWFEPEYTTEIFEPKERGEAHAGILRSFADAVLHGSELIAPGYEGLNELAISNAAYLSDWTGKGVEIPFDEELFDTMLSERRRSGRKKSGGKQQTHESYSERWNVRF